MAQQAILYAILGVTLCLFAWGRIRYDLVALLAMLATVVTGIVPADEAFAGFGHPAVITVAAVLILSRAIRRSGLVEWIVRATRRTAEGTGLQILVLCAVTAACSAFMNNVAALALMLPVALQVAERSNRSASLLLMPIAFASLLGGLTTLIGTPPNIIIASARGTTGAPPFAMFDFAPVGLMIAVAGVLFIALIGWRLLPTRQASRAEEGEPPLFDIQDYITEVRVPTDSPFVGKRLMDVETLGQGDLSIVALVRNRERILAPSGFFRLQADDILILEAHPATLRRVAEKADLDMMGAGGLSPENLRSERVGLVEAVVVPGSQMEGRTARSMRLHTRFGLNLLAVARQGEQIQERLGQVRLAVGDVLLLQGEREGMAEALSALGCLPLAQRDLQLGRNTGESLMAPVIFGISILLVVAGLVPPQIGFAGAAIAVVLSGALPLRELYESVEWPVIVLLGAMIPVGVALETTGATATIVAPILSYGDNLPLWLILGVLLLVTMMLTDIMNNAATAVLMAPIAISLGQGLGINPDPLLMAVAIGASSSFLTPIGHQSNLLVMGPGGYRFGDYWRMGLPLELLILLVAVPMILLVWPA